MELAKVTNITADTDLLLTLKTNENGTVLTYRKVKDRENYLERTILVVDDDLNFLEWVSTLLGDEGYTVDTAKSGSEGIEKCEETLYSLILIDIKLPNFEGIQVLERIKDVHPKARKVIITGYPTLENAKQALNLGANAYIVKPVDAEKLLKTVEEQFAEFEKASEAK